MPRRPALWASLYAALALTGVVVGLVAGGAAPASAGTHDPAVTRSPQTARP